MNDIPTVIFPQSEAPICEVHKIGTMRPCTAYATVNITIHSAKADLTLNLCQKHLTRIQDALKPPSEENV